MKIHNCHMKGMALDQVPTTPILTTQFCYPLYPRFIKVKVIKTNDTLGVGASTAYSQQ